jgi:hypothetical protein
LYDLGEREVPVKKAFSEQITVPNTLWVLEKTKGDSH